MRRFTLFIGLVAVLNGCGDSSPGAGSPTATFPSTSTPSPSPSPSPTPILDARTLLAKNRELWRNTGAVRYRMLERVLCFCLFDHPHLVAIEVLNDQIVLLRDVWTGAEVVDPPADAYRTVDGIFDLIEDAIDIHADRISVEYSRYVGVPMAVFVDYDAMIYDDEMGFELSDMIIWTSE